jgi:AmmeMemoRadiSam system protein B
MTAALTDIRAPILAGTWYPAQPDNLTRTIDDFLAQADPPAPNGTIRGLLVPHAGLIYSGSVAAHAFKLIQGMRPDIVAVLCPYHRPHLADLLTTAHDAYQTPLGTVPVDLEAIAALGAQIPLKPVRNDPEHALEIELPFLQRVLPAGFDLLPLMLINQTTALAEQLGRALAAVLRGRNALLIASSDLSHFFPQAIANELDQRTLEAVRAYDPAAVITAGKQPGEGACGRGAISAVMWAAREMGADTAEIIRYATSGDTSGDYERVVGYGAGVFYQRNS